MPQNIDEAGHKRGPAAGRYHLLTSDRDAYLRRARKNARLTIPSLISQYDHNHQNTGSEELETPYNDLGARGVNNLSSKLLLSLFPTNTPFYKEQLDEFKLIEEAKKEGRTAEEIRAGFEDGLGRVERAVMAEFDSTAIRVDLYEAFRHLLVTGNVLLYFDPTNGRAKVFHLDKYVVRRDGRGDLVEAVVQEMFLGLTLPDKAKEAVGSVREDETYPVYTHIYWDGKEWIIYQEIEGAPFNSGSFPKSKLPWLALRGIKKDGEHYGRSYVEELEGSLNSLEGLSKAIVEGSLGAAKCLWGVDPNSVVSIKELSTKPNMGFFSGKEGDVWALRMDKGADFQVALERSRDLERQLSLAFLMNTAVQRPAERVTAEEIRFVAQELENGLGGIYSVLAQELQLPLVELVKQRMTKQKRLPKLPDELLKTRIVAGLQALGRGHEFNQLDMYLNFVQARLGEEGIRRLEMDNILLRGATAIGIETQGLVKSEQKLAEEAQQQQMAQLAQDAGPKAIQEVVRANVNQPKGEE